MVAPRERIRQRVGILNDQAKRKSFTFPISDELRHQRAKIGTVWFFNRDKVNLNIFWLRDESLEEFDSLPDPDVLAQEIVEDLEAALERFREIAVDLAGEHVNP